MRKGVERCENCIAPKGKRCPFWIGVENQVFEKNVSTGDQRPVIGCFPTVFMRLMEFVVHTNVSAAAAAETARNEIALGFSNVSRVLDIAKDMDMVKQLEAAVMPRRLEMKADGKQETE